MHGINCESFVISFWMKKNPFMCGFICLQYLYYDFSTEEASSSSNYLDHEQGIMDVKT